MSMKPRRFVYMFQPQFVAQIVAGEKVHTIRPRAKRYSPIWGDILRLRQWSGLPYRSPQVQFGEALSSSSQGIIIHADGIEMCPGTLRVFFIGERNSLQRLDEFARKDGFKDWPEMREWFNARYKLPFECTLIGWRDFASTHENL